MAIETIKVLDAITLSATETEVAGVKQTATIRLPEGYTPLEFSVGTGAGQANKYYVLDVSLAGSATTLNLNSLSGGFGDTSLANLRGWKIYNRATNAAHV